MAPAKPNDKKPVGGQKGSSHPQPVAKTGIAGQEARDDSAVRTSGIHQGVKPS